MGINVHGRKFQSNRLERVFLVPHCIKILGPDTKMTSCERNLQIVGGEMENLVTHSWALVGVTVPSRRLTESSPSPRGVLG